jgi:hypothetical protein
VHLLFKANTQPRWLFQDILGKIKQNEIFISPTTLNILVLSDFRGTQQHGAQEYANLQGLRLPTADTTAAYLSANHTLLIVARQLLKGAATPVKKKTREKKY